MPTKSPLPRQPVRGSATGRPIMALLDLLGRRWGLRVLWELQEGPLTFRALQAACDGVSPTVLQQRLKELRAARLVVHDGGRGYVLTEAARRLQPNLMALHDWAEDWAKDGGSEEQE
ncbi:helix-turn-helix transcriptional regulator [Ferrovibrio terrae]|uniref:Helix-turn-helix transcriptional regulator n=2 Tax=Ferrovibrio terrae TaxID=2594003 RepID=A0A516H2J6_9PROT|nr:helix-turn-helix transcriptional regulator [Ferrovibrio terrae]